MNKSAVFPLLLVLLSALFAGSVAAVQTAGETVLVRDAVQDDLYLAGGRVDVLAEAADDVLVAGGRVAIDSQVGGDVIAAGGSVTVHGRVEDDARLAGGEVVVNAAVDDDVVAAGGNVLLAPAASVGGDFMASGGRVDLAGRVSGDARLAGGMLAITGQVDGNVELVGRVIEIGPGAVVLGSLTYRSPEPAQIDPQARIEGEVTHISTPMPGAEEVAGGLAAAALLIWLSLALTGVVLFLLLSRPMLAVGRTMGSESWKCLGLGLAVFSATPLVGIMLLTTGLGWLLAWLLMTLYCLLLLFGFLNAVLFLGEGALRRMRHGKEVGRLGVSVIFTLALLVVMIVALVPLIGWLLVFLLLLLGVGGTVLQSYRAKSACLD